MAPPGLSMMAQAVWCSKTMTNSPGPLQRWTILQRQSRSQPGPVTKPAHIPLRSLLRMLRLKRRYSTATSIAWSPMIGPTLTNSTEYSRVQRFTAQSPIFPTGPSVFHPSRLRLRANGIRNMLLCRCSLHPFPLRKALMMRSGMSTAQS